MQKIIKRLEKNNIKYKVCNEKNQQINLYVKDKVVISYYCTTGTIYSPYVDLKKYKNIDDLIYLYNTIFNNKFINEYLLKQLEVTQEQVEYLRRSVERKEESLLEEQMESLDMVNIIGQLSLYLEFQKDNSIFFKRIYDKIEKKLKELKERYDYYE